MNATTPKQDIDASTLREEGAHTPGPWEAEEGAARGAWIKGSTGEWSALACGDTESSAKANARLIAAAPDLLAALVALEGYLRTTPHHNVMEAAAARAVIAKLAKATKP